MFRIAAHLSSHKMAFFERTHGHPRKLSLGYYYVIVGLQCMGYLQEVETMGARQRGVSSYFPHGIYVAQPTKGDEGQRQSKLWFERLS